MKAAFIISGVLGIVVWPFVMLAGVTLMDAPEVPIAVEVLRQIAAYSAILTPAVWMGALVLAVIEAKKKKRPNVLRAYAAAPYAAAGLHAVSLVVLFTLPQ
jgi:membrane protein DedA with SNARE-associated domain